MADEPGTTGDPLSLEDVARAALELGSVRELDGLLSAFLERLRAWASPSAVLAAVKDPASEGGWRLLSPLSAGSGPLGAERALRQLVEDVPEGLVRPMLVRPGGEVPGVRVRDNCIVPWSCEGESGILVLRGVPRPSAPNLPEAVAVLAAPVWPRLLGGPAERVEASFAELRRLAERLQTDAARQLERLKAARLAAEAGHRAEASAAAARAADLERQLDLSRQEAKGAVLAREELRKRVTALEAALRRAEQDRDWGRGEIERLSARAASVPVVSREQLEGARREAEEARRAAENAQAAARAAEEHSTEARRDLAESRHETQRATLELEDLKERMAALEGAVRAAEGERDRAQAEVERLSAAKAQEEESAARRLEQVRQEAEEALALARRDAEAVREEARRGILERETLKERTAALESAVRAAEEERDRARAEVERLSAASKEEESAERRLEQLRQEAEEALALARRDVEAVREEARRGILERETLEERLSAAEKSHAEADEERDRLRGEAERLSSRLEAARSDLAAATEQVEELRRERDEALAAAARAQAEGERVERALAEGGRPESGGDLSSPRPEVGAGSDDIVAAFRSALAVLRRTPFVPPALRISVEQAEKQVQPEADRRTPWLRIVLLDRDAASLEPLATELEEAGLDVRIANYPEELALLMKTPDARDLSAAICDVLAFRPDQNVSGLFRSWQKDRPSLALYLSFSTESPAEAERAQRVPNSLTAGRFRRPLVRQDIVEMLTSLARRSSPA